jgi:hypothetical protein
LHPKDLHDPLSRAQKFANIPWAFPEVSPMPFKRCSKSFHTTAWGTFPSVCRHTFYHFRYSSREGAVLHIYKRLKLKTKQKNFNTIRGSSPTYALLDQNYFSQHETDLSVSFTTVQEMLDSGEREWQYVAGPPVISGRPTLALFMFY